MISVLSFDMDKIGNYGDRLFFFFFNKNVKRVMVG